MKELIDQARLRGLSALAGPFPDFDASSAPSTPHELFQQWFADALEADICEPHAMTLSTCDGSGMPDARVLLLKDVDEEGWYFATGRESAKGRQIADFPHAALTFYWQPIGRQVRVRGRVVEADQARCEEDFRDRSFASRQVALTGMQSRVLQDRNELPERLARNGQRLGLSPDLVAPGWSVYRVEASEVEFWQARSDRAHIRLLYNRNAESATWTRSELWP